ncbi:hypothetical protein ACJX0J_003872, partial [Zea mays]
DDIHPIKKEIIRIRNRKNFFFFFKFNSLFIFYSKILPKIQFHFSMGFHNKSLDSELGTHNLSFGFLFFYLESAFKTKKKRKSFSIPNDLNLCATSLFQINFLVISCFWSHIIKEGKDYYSLDLGQDYSYARDRILRDMTKISPF